MICMSNPQSLKMEAPMLITTEHFNIAPRPRLAFLALILSASLQSILFGQQNEPLPLLPVTGDREQINSILSTMEQQLRSSRANKSVCQLDVHSVSIERRSAFALCTLISCEGDTVKEVQVAFEKRGTAWQPKLTSTLEKLLRTPAEEEVGSGWGLENTSPHPSFFLSVSNWDSLVL